MRTRVVLIISAVVVVAIVALLRLRGGDRIVKYSPPPPVREPDRLAEADQVIAQITAAVTQKAAAAVPTMDSSSERFNETLSAVLQAYNSGTEAAFTEARRAQGFTLPDNWENADSLKQTLSAQSGLLGQVPAQPEIKVTRRIVSGTPMPEAPLAPGTRRTAGTIGIARGDGDILDPVVEKADALEVSFPQRVRDLNGRTADGTMRIWLVKRPNDSQWLVYRIVLEYPDESMDAVVLPPF